MGVGYEDDPVDPEVQPNQEAVSPAPPAPDPIAEAVAAARRAAEAAAAWSQYGAQAVQNAYATPQQPPEVELPETVDPEAAAYFERKVEEKLEQYFNQFGQAYQRDRMTDYAYREQLERERARQMFPGFSELEGDINQMTSNIPLDQRANPGFYQTAYHAALGARVAQTLAERARQAPAIATGVGNIPASGGGFTSEDKEFLRDRWNVDPRAAELLSNKVVDVDEYLAAMAARKK